MPLSRLLSGAVRLLVTCIVLTTLNPSLWAQNPGDDDPYRIPVSALQASQRLLNSGQREEGRAIARKVLDTASGNLKAGDTSAMNHFILGMASELLGLKSMGLDYLRKSVELEPGYLPAHQALTKALLDSGRPSDALSNLEDVTDHFSGVMDFQILLAEVYRSNGRPEEAVTVYEGVRVADPGNERTFNRLLALYVETGNLTEAEIMLDQLVEAEKLSGIDRDLALADMCLGAGDHQKARRHLQDVRRLDPENPAIPASMARYYDVLAVESKAGGQLSRAILYWERSLEFDPEIQSVRIRLGSAYGESGDYRRSLEMLEPLLVKVPEDPEFYVAFVKALHAAGREELAFETLDRVTEIVRFRNDTEALALFEETRADLSDGSMSP